MESQDPGPFSPGRTPRHDHYASASLPHLTLWPTHSRSLSSRYLHLGSPLREMSSAYLCIFGLQIRLSPSVGGYGRDGFRTQAMVALYDICFVIARTECALDADGCTFCSDASCAATAVGLTSVVIWFVRLSNLASYSTAVGFRS